MNGNPAKKPTGPGGTGHSIRSAGGSRSTATASQAARVPVYVTDTGACGQGTFAAAAISRGTLVATLAGERISSDTCAQRVHDGVLRLDDPLQIGKLLYLDLDDASRLFNHSCNPNLGLRNESDLFALRDISRDEELRYDYATTVSSDISISTWTMRCCCGAANCRELIGHVLTIPLAQTAAYLRAGTFQAFILRELRQVVAALDIARRVPARAVDKSAATARRGDECDE